MKGIRVHEVLKELPQPEAEALTKHLEGQTSSVWLSEVLTRHGHPVSESTIRAYRRAQKGMA